MSAIPTIRAFLSLAILALAASPLWAQDNAKMEEVKALVRQIQRNMVEAERDIDRVEGQDAAERGAQSKKDLEELVDRLKRRGGQISTDIEAVIQKLPKGGGGGGGGGGGSQGKSGGKGSENSSGNKNSRENEGNSGQRDKNERDGQGEGQRNEQQNRSEGNQNQNDRDTKDSGADNQGDGQNRQGPNQNPPPPEFIIAPDDAQRWGFLPRELRQRLLDRNFREFTPEYQQEIKAYFRRLSKPKR